MACYYTLLFHYNDQKFYLAPRFSIQVVEDNDLDNLESTSGCATCSGKPSDRSWHFKVNFQGGCDLASAWALYNQFQTFINAACSGGYDLIVERTVCDEAALVYKVTKTTAKMVDVINQYLRKRVLTMDVVIELTAWIQTGEGVVLVG